MNKWLIVHSLEAWGDNSRRIGFGGRSNLDGSLKLDENGKPIPLPPKLLEIQPGDRIVYYCKGDSVVKGIYEIVKACSNGEKEKQWPDAPFQFEIAPIYELSLIH